MKKILSIILTLTLSATVFAQPLPKKLEHNEKMAWWRNAKFGMFVHWGPYCLYGGVYNGFNQRRGGAEWIMNRCKIPVREYRAKACTFNPVDFNAEELVLTAKNAGMKYIIFTTKHHDGFAMFKSNASEFNIVDYTPFKRDIVDELAKACRKHHIKLGFYYSQTQDWCNPGGGTIRKEMKEGWANPDSVAIDNFTQENLGGWDCLQRSASLDDYFRKVAIPQIKELLTNYGDVAVMWWDTPHRISKETAAEITAELAKYPQVITNDRLRRPDFPGDYKTPEGRIPHAKDIERVDWETCMNIGSSWGYKSWEKNWKSAYPMVVMSNASSYILPTLEDFVRSGELTSEEVDYALHCVCEAAGKATFIDNFAKEGLRVWMGVPHSISEDDGRFMGGYLEMFWQSMHFSYTIEAFNKDECIYVLDPKELNSCLMGSQRMSTAYIWFC